MKLTDLFEEQKLTLVTAKGGCATCPRKRRAFVPPLINDNSDLLFIGDFPDATSVEKQKAFAGEDGAKLKSLLKKYEINDYSLAYAIQCNTDNKNGPTPKELSSCANQYLVQTIRKHRVVVLMGDTALNNIFPGERANHLRGNFIYHPDFPGIRFFGTYSSKYTQISRESAAKFEAHIDRLSRVLKADPEEPEFVVFSPKELKDDFISTITKVLKENKLVSLDIETDSLKSWDPNANLKSLSFCVNDKEAYFVDDTSPYWKPTLDLIRELIEDESKTVVGHNMGFDVEWLERVLGTFCKARVLCTQTLYYQWKDRETNRWGYKMPSLKLLVSVELDGYRHMIIAPHKETNLDLLQLYNGEDVIRTLQLLQKALPHIDKDTLRLFLEVASYSNLSLRRISTEGVGFSLSKWQAAKEESEKNLKGILDKWEEEDPDFKRSYLDTQDGLHTYLFKIKKYPVVNTTETGQASTDKFTIKELIRKKNAHVLENLLDYRKEEKLYNTYINKYDGHVDPVDLRVHPSFTNSRTDTGRTSSFSPNLQNIPRGPRIRPFFTDDLMVHADFSQMEVRVAMSLANDTAGIEAYLSGMDAHQITAQAIVGEDREATDEDRTKAKAVNFGMLFGGSPYTLQNYAKNTYDILFTDEEAEEHHGVFFTTYPGLKSWQEGHIINFRREKGWVKTVVGHQHYYKDWNHKESWMREHAERASLNTLVQGPAGYMTLHIIGEIQKLIHEYELQSRVTITVHDSVIFRCPANELPTIKRIIGIALDRTAMWVRDWLQVPLVMDMEYGPYWESWKNKDLLNKGEAVSGISFESKVHL